MLSNCVFFNASYVRKGPFITRGGLTAQAAPGRRTVAGREGLLYTDAVRVRLPAVLVSALLLAAITTNAQIQREYTQLETEDAFVYMDGEGVAVRVMKNWSCRHGAGASNAEPMVLGKEDYAAFRARRIADGTWKQWSCPVVLGPVTFSREVQEAQRKMNMAPNKPDCVPWVPETGRLNWETLDYARCYLSKDAERARSVYKDKFAARLTSIIGDETAGYDALVARAKSTRLAFPHEGCDRSLDTIYDVVACRMERHGQVLLKAEEFFAFYSERVANLRGTDPILQTHATGLSMDADLVRKHLRRAQREADGL